jgi:hypothetical protein
LAAFDAAHRDLVAALAEVDDAREFGEAIAQADLTDILEPPQARAEHPVGQFAPNVTMFPTILQGIEAHSSARRIDNVRVIHDEQHEFEETFRQWLELAQNAAPGSIVLPTGREITPRVERIASLGFRDSTSCRPLRVADCMAAIGRVCVNCAVPPHEDAPPILKQFRPLLRSFLAARSGDAFPWVVGPLDWQPMALSALSGLGAHEYGAA